MTPSRSPMPKEAKPAVSERLRALADRCPKGMSDYNELLSIADDVERVAGSHRATLAQMDADERCPVRYARSVNEWAAALAPQEDSK